MSDPDPDVQPESLPDTDSDAYSDASTEFTSPSDLPLDDSWRDVRPVALGIVRRDDEMLVAEAYDRTDDETFYRPVGGGLYSGEFARSAVVREFEEELDWRMAVEERLAVLENIFTFDGTSGHEYDLVFEVTPEDDAVFERDEFVGDSAPPLYPEGLRNVLV